MRTAVAVRRHAHSPAVGREITLPTCALRHAVDNIGVAARSLQRGRADAEIAPAVVASIIRMAGPARPQLDPCHCEGAGCFGRRASPPRRSP